MKFRKKPIEVEAVKFDRTEAGDMRNEVLDFVNNLNKVRMEHGYLQVYNDKEHQWINVPLGHWVIRGVAGEFYPCDPEVFDQTYEAVEEEN